MQVEWYGQSAFRLTDGATTVFIDPFDDLAPLAARGLRWDYPAIDGVRGRPAARHPRAPRPQRRRRDRRRPGDPALDRRAAGVADRRGPRRRLRARRGRRHRARPEHALRLHARRACASPTSATSARRAPARRAGRGARRPSTSSSSRSAAGRRSAPSRRPRSPRGSARAVVVPMHYRTERIDFLEPVDAFLGALDPSRDSTRRASTRPTCRTTARSWWYRRRLRRDGGSVRGAGAARA